MVKRILREKAFQSFLLIREKLNKAQDYYSGANSFREQFKALKQKAATGDAISQDAVAYYYKNGVENFLYENYERYLYWELLSGANGNEFAIEKLQFMFGYAYDTIVADTHFPRVKFYCNIDEFNYVYVLGQRLCDALVEHFNLDSKKLSDLPDEYQPYKPETFRDFRKAIDQILPDLILTMARQHL